MKVVALISGGKDSCYAMMKCIQYGHEIVALANLLPVDDSVDELDSYMYQTVGHQIVVSYAKCMGLPLFRRRLQGSTRHHNLNYKMTPGDEVEDMFVLLNEIKQQLPSVQAVSSGAIASDYQRLRVESVCSRLGLVSLAYLWKQDQSFLLQEMITNGITAILVKVAAIGLDPQKHLGKELIDLDSHLHHLKDLYGINVCGEGGEYETLTLDCPLFKFARIVMGNFQIILHSPDSIAPVGVLHPLSFHVEAKGDSTASLEYVDCVCEVQGDCLQIHATKTPDLVLDTTIINHHKVQVSKTRRDDIFSICCWLQDPCGAPAGLQDDLRVVLEKIESQLKDAGLGWEHALYIHLYVADMTQFAAANETYVHFITQEKCWFGVPSRSTIELPLLQVGLGRAYIEVLVAKDETKRVLHVQSISCWAPSCIGPYSQATLHNGILFMAGQLGLDPPTMVLCDGGAATEMEQALAHSEAIAKCFNCSVCSSAIAITIYCSTNIELWERTKVQEKLEMFIKNMEKLHSDGRKVSNVLEPVVLYVLVPNLPKRALVEVKPMLYVAEDWETAGEDVAQGISCSDQQGCWGFQYQQWHDDCLRKCVIREKVCAAVVCLTDELMEKLGQHCLLADQNGSIAQDPLVWEFMENVAKFCIYRFDRLLREETFSWQDVLYLRIYIHSGFPVSMEKFSLTLTNAFREFTELNPKCKSFPEPLLSLIPVLASGRCAVSMDAAITCELLAQKPCEL